MDNDGGRLTRSQEVVQIRHLVWDWGWDPSRTHTHHQQAVIPTYSRSINQSIDQSDQSITPLHCVLCFARVRVRG
jgi:hypothetical protein